MMNLRLALRRLRAAPVFTVFSIGTLACGIGITTAAYSAIYAMGARPLDVVGADELAVLTRSTSIVRTRSFLLNAAEIVALTDGLRPVRTAGWFAAEGVLAGPAMSEQVTGELVTSGYFDLVGTPMAAGRALADGDFIPGATPVLVLSHLSWRRHFEADPRAIGARIRFAGAEFEIVGVTSRSFRGVGQRVVGGISVWVPLVQGSSLTGTAGRMARTPEFRALSVIVRRPPAMTLTAASEAVTEFGRALDLSAPQPAVAPGAPAGARNWALTSLEEALDFRQNEITQVVMMMPLIVLLVACTNLANLVLSRSASRRHEYAVRRALGASRWQLLREALTESLLVVGGGALLGMGLAHGLLSAGIVFLREPAQAMNLSVPLDWQLDPILLTGAAGSAILSFLVAGLFPALRMTRADPGRSLTTGDAVQMLPKWRGRSNLIALQLGVSTALFLITVIAARFILIDPPRFVEQDPAVAGLTIAELRVESPASSAQRGETMSAIVSEVRRQPAVAVAAAATGLPFGITRGSMLSVEVTRSDAPDAVALSRINPGREAALIGTTPDLFRTLGIRLLAGRDFLGDAGADPNAVIVDEHVARQAFGDGSAIGQEIVVHGAWEGDRRLSPRTLSIVGIVPGRTYPNGQARRLVYVPLSVRSGTAMVMVARPRDGNELLLDGFRASIRAVDADLALGAGGSGRVMAERGFGVLRVLAVGLGVLATLTLVLATAGLYGVLMDVVTRRTRELGIRVALGASARRITSMVLRQGARPIVEGMFIGLASAAVIRHLMQQQLTATLSASSLLVGTAAIVPLLLVGLIAAYLPARRAARVNPNVALRTL